MCDKETECDGDSFRCYDCNASWSMDGTSGGWDDTDEGCPAVIEYYNRPNLDPEHESIRHHQDRCILAFGDHIQHRAMDPWIKWDDEDIRVVVKGDVDD